MIDRFFSSSCCGTLGELYQGPLYRKNSTEISIISALSNNKTIASLRPGEQCNLTDLKKFKVKESLDNFFTKISSREIKGSWHFQSDIKVGAGMSSSTSDIISALRCVSKLLNVHLTLDDIISCLVGVERSDSVFIAYPCLYLSEQQRIIELYRPQEKIYCIYGLEDKVTDTTETRDTLISYYNSEKLRYKNLLNEVYEAFRRNSLQKIIECSTKSATLSQEVYPKECFRPFIKNINKFHANGLIVAHTGALIGFLYANKPTVNIKSRVIEFINGLGMKAAVGDIF